VRVRGDSVDAVVIGAGVVGLAVAAALARSGRSALVLERNDGIAREVTSRNSEVIHAGIYYPKDSLKAVLCVRGRELLYERCEQHGIAHRKLGKLIVATNDAELQQLHALRAHAEDNGVPGMQLLGGAAVTAREPQVSAVAALLSPETGIVDGHALCLSYLAEAEAHGAQLLLRHEVVAIERTPDGWRVEAQALQAGADEANHSVDCELLVNAAGLASDRIAELAGLDTAQLGYRIHPCKGDYFALAPGRRLSLSHLVYPVPTQAGLGIHATLDLAGAVRFGPDTEYQEAPSYRVDPEKRGLFARAIERYLPAVEPDWLQPDYAGIRPKLAGPGEAFRDFVVAEEGPNGAPGLIDCIGIESPGLTAAGAIAERVVALV
jgi:L-2-hydroxyglutarate oxidase LhgO